MKDVVGKDGAENPDSTDDDDQREEDLSPELVELDYTPDELKEIYDNTDIEVLRLALDETQPTLNTIQEFLSDIDDKAGQTLRLNAVILGIILTIISLSSSIPETNMIQFVNLGFYAGLVASGVSFVASLITYTRSSIIAGITVGDVKNALEQPIGEKSLLLSLLVAHGQWIRRNGQVNKRDAFTLFIGHIFLLLSIGYYSLAVFFSFLSLPVWIKILYIIILSVVLITVIYVPQTQNWGELWAWAGSIKEDLLETIGNIRD